jgi:hypothetical protein
MALTKVSDALLASTTFAPTAHTHTIANVTSLQTSLDAKAPLASPSFTGNVTVAGTVDGVDVSVRDAVLTTTTTTASAALPKAGGTMTGKLTLPVAGLDLPVDATYITGSGHSILKADSTRTYFYGGSAGAQIRKADNSTHLVDITDSGNVTVTGTLAAASFSGDGSTLSNVGVAGITTDSSSGTAMYVSSANNVGMGGGVMTSSAYPRHQLHLDVSTSSAGSYFPMCISGSSHLQNYGVGIAFKAENPVDLAQAAIIGEGQGTGYNYTNLHLCVRNNTGTEVGISDSVLKVDKNGLEVTGTTEWKPSSGNTTVVGIINDSGSGVAFANSGGASAGALQLSYSGSQPTLWIKDAGGSGTQTAIRFNRSSSSTIGNINTTPTSTSYNTSSDYRLKENLVPITDSIERVKTLKPYRFNFIADPDVTVDGFVAHEVIESGACPEAISGEKDAMRIEEYEVTPAVMGDDGTEIEPAVMGEHEYIDPQSIDQAKLVPLLTASILELISRVESLESQLNNS